jgi:hypothetical protein
MRVTVRKVALQLLLDQDRTYGDAIVVIAEKVEWSLHNCRARQLFSLDVYKFHIHYIGENSAHDSDYDEALPILSFHDRTSKTFHDGISHSENSTDPVVSIHFDSGKYNGETYLHSDVRIAVEPFTFLYRQLALSKMASGLERITKNKRSETHDFQSHTTSSTADSMHFNCQIFCVYVLLIIPFNISVDDESPWTTKLPLLFERSGYNMNPCPILNGPAMTVELTNFGVKYGEKSNLDDNVDYEEDFRLALTFQNTIIAIVSPVFMWENKSVQDECIHKLDLIAIESEDTIDPNALVRIEFSQSSIREAEFCGQSKARFLFPIVQPLALVKASQQFDDCAECDETSSKPEHKSAKSRQSLRGSDPQKAVLNEISDCKSILSVHIPSMALDLSTVEIDVLSEILASYKAKGSTEPERNNISQNQEQVSSKSLSLQCNQLSVSIHYISDDDSCSTKNLNHLLIIDDFKCFFLQQQQALRSLRTLCEDITLFEGKERNPGFSFTKQLNINFIISIGVKIRAVKSTQDGTHGNGTKDMCEYLRKRRTENYDMVSAVFFRSKMSQPLSPKTPAVLVDLIMNRDEHNVERSIHVSLYDMTYRYDCQSLWIEKLRMLIPSGDSKQDVSDISVSTSNDTSTLNNVSARCCVVATSPCKTAHSSFISTLRLGFYNFF